MDGFVRWLLNPVEIVIRLAIGMDVSEQTADMTSPTSVGFSLRGCCSLNHEKLETVSETQIQHRDDFHITFYGFYLLVFDNTIKFNIKHAIYYQQITRP